MRILIAEDAPVARHLLQQYLQEWGHEVVATRNGVEAWQYFTRGDFPIVLSDWMMPEMDGLELVHRIRATPRQGYVYIILLTARSETEDVVRGMDAGADDFISKPFAHEEQAVVSRSGQVEAARRIVWQFAEPAKLDVAGRGSFTV